MTGNMQLSLQTLVMMQEAELQKALRGRVEPEIQSYPTSPCLV